MEITASGPLKAGDKLGHIAPTQYALSVPESCPLEHFSQLRVRQLGQREALFSLPPIARCADQAAGFDVPVPPGLGLFEEGHALIVTLETTNGPRNSLTLPSDCLIKQGESQEVLLHHGHGKLTPTAIQTSIINDTVEVLHGLSNSAQVVRDLKQLCQRDRRIRALMTGFWTG